MRLKTILAFLVLTSALGCAVPDRIREIQPPEQPPLPQLEQHLDYQDPDAGEPDYIVE
ncbi:MAG: hypothetical protein R6X33_11725 [Candidatus Brocadiia bacterium]